MEIIDFVNDCPYTLEPGTKDNKQSHPKIFIISPNGDIYYADKSNDDKYITIFEKHQYLENHVAYMNVLIEKYFSHNIMLVNNAKKRSLAGFYENLLEFVDEGYIIFNNMTSYAGVMYSEDKLTGQILIPKEITDDQKKSLKAIDPYVNYFKEIDITEFKSDKNCKYYEQGYEAISNYLERTSNGKKIS